MSSLGYQYSSDEENGSAFNGGVALSSDKETVVGGGLLESVTMRPRSYQVEMFEESMKRNIVVTMDTGSGKTHIAVLRIDAELARGEPEKLTWFLAPTVSLCQQQYNGICTQLPAVPVCFLSGADNVVRWSNQSIWNEVLNGVKVVVSTHQVLYDALAHGFVNMGRLSLLIFDEAHHCVESHPANKIMQDFYHQELQKKGPKAVPHILGMSASPVVKSKPGGLQILERNLNAISKTPRIHREELMKYVHPPLLEKLVYPVSAKPEGLCPAYNSLLDIYQRLNIMEDPYVVSLLESMNSARAKHHLQKVILSRQTYCEDQFKGICTRSSHIFEELGLWATNYYIVNSIARLRSSRQDNEILEGWSGEEKRYLLEKLGQVQMPSEGELEPDVLGRHGQVSPKLKQLIELLVRESVPDFAGLIFIQQRAAVAVLSQLLSVHPQTKHLFDCATFVGTSWSPFRKARAIGDLIEPRLQKDTLDNFRNGRKNLVIATSVLEEGIDVSACHIVICYEKPPNLKSFVQRRGRARARESKYVIMLENTDASAAVSRWQNLEEEMIRMYMDDKRRLDEICEKEFFNEGGRREYRVPSTGALLTLDNAKSHLHHFCATLPKSQYVDLRPEFTIMEDPQTKLVSAVVTLPNSVHPSVRQAAGIKKWRTERMALKDAAFEMYLKLYRAELVNDNLLPLKADDTDDDMKVAVEKRPSIVDVSEQLNPWVAVARQWSEFSSNLFVSVVEIDDGMNTPVRMNLFLPVCLPCTPEFTLFWDETAHFRVSIRQAARAAPNLFRDVNKLRDVTHLLLMSVFSSRMNSQGRDYPALFYPMDIPEDRLPQLSGVWPASEILLRQTPHIECGIVREISQSFVAYIYNGICDEDGDIGELYLFARRLPKRRDFLHVVGQGSKNSNVSQSKPEDLRKQEKILAQHHVIDNLPFRYAQFALFIPSILHHVEISLVASELQNTILAPVDIQDLGLVITAISASSAREATNYQRIEFLGDSILKLCTSVQVIAEHQTWHEGYLSAKKDRTVANSRLARSAREIGLDKFILTKAFTGQKWKPFYISSLLEDPGCAAKRAMSTKVLADVVEALIGASFMDGGFDKAVKCLRVFLPEIRWENLRTNNALLYTAAKLEITVPAHFSNLEHLIGYKFSKPSLLFEATMHPSCETHSAAVSYQRLEFLGDSVLDYIVVSNLFSPEKDPEKEFSHMILHLARTVLVNADFLAFLCMEAAVDVVRPDIIEAKEKEDFGKIEKRVPVQLWKFMRHHSHEIAQAQAACMGRYEMLKGDIRKGLQVENGYPWAALARLEADKFFSDLVESLIGAVYVDSGGNFKTCEEVLEKLGFFQYLKRILDGEVDMWHPKEMLGQLANQDRVDYVVGISGEGQAEAGEQREYWCKVLIEGKEIVCVGGGSNRVEVKTRAAEAAVRLLKEQRKREKDVVMEDDDITGQATEEVEDWIREDIAEEEEHDVMAEEESYPMPGAFV